MATLAALHTEVWLFIGAGLVSLLAFGAFILSPTIGSFGRTWEKVTALVLSLFVFAALVGAGLAIGVLIVLNWPQISGLV